MKELLDIIKKVAGEHAVIAVQSGKAKNVSDTKCDVEREGERSDLLGVRLNAAVDTKHYHTVVPKEGSEVLVAVMDGRKAEAFVIGVSEVEKVIGKIDTVAYEISKEGYQLKRGSESLKKLLNDLLSEIMKITVTTSAGPSGVPINAPQLTQIQQRIPNLLK